MQGGEIIQPAVRPLALWAAAILEGRARPEAARGPGRCGPGARPPLLALCTCDLILPRGCHVSQPRAVRTAWAGGACVERAGPFCCFAPHGRRHHPALPPTSPPQPGTEESRSFRLIAHCGIVQQLGAAFMWSCAFFGFLLAPRRGTLVCISARMSLAPNACAQLLALCTHFLLLQPNQHCGVRLACSLCRGRGQPSGCAALCCDVFHLSACYGGADKISARARP